MSRTTQHPQPPVIARRRRLNVRRAGLCFLAAYVIVTVLAGGLTTAYTAIAGTQAEDERATSPVKAPSFTTTVPWHVLIMVVVWTIFAWVYWRGTDRNARPDDAHLNDLQAPGVSRDRVREATALSFSWLIAAMVVDFVGFVVVRNPWSLTPRQFYVDYQPWITLIYVAIFASPWLYLALTGRLRPGR